MVCSRTGAFEALVVPGENGYLVDTGDAKGLAKAVEMVMSNPEKALAMGEAARQRVTHLFSLEQEAAGIGRVYQTLFELV